MVGLTRFADLLGLVPVTIRGGGCGGKLTLSCWISNEVPVPTLRPAGLGSLWASHGFELQPTATPPATP